MGAANEQTDCVAHTQCGKQLAVDDEEAAPRLTGASETAAGSCADCDAGTYAADGQTNCASYTQCGKRADGESRLIGANATTAGTCAPCADDFYAANGKTDCVANTQCGDQLNGISRLTGASRTTAGSCAPCNAGTYAADGQTDCESHTQCGKGADGESRLTGANATTAGTCAACAATTFAESGADHCACDKGSGCVSDDPGSCSVPLVCELCKIPEANNAVDKTQCDDQVCNAGFGYDRDEGFDSTLNPKDPTNPNCHACDNGKFSPGGTGQCVDYSTDESCPPGYNRDTSHNSKHSDRECVDITPPKLYLSSNNDIYEGYDDVGKVVFTGTASDTSNLTVSLTLGGTDASSFVIEPDADDPDDPDTFVVKTKVAFDYEFKNTFSIIVTATDAAQQSTSESKTVNILNLDEVVPRFTSGPASDILESAAPGTAVYTAITLDNYDISGGVTYTLSDSDALDIDEHSGQVTLKSAISEGEYSFKVTATDAARKAAEQPISLTVRPDEDQDAIDDEHDKCFIIRCTAQQLTDAYAMLKENSECSNSRRVHSHANEIRNCVTTECGETHISQIKSAIETKQSEC